jgi:hypothetical protein
MDPNCWWAGLDCTLPVLLSLFVVRDMLDTLDTLESPPSPPLWFDAVSSPSRHLPFSRSPPPLLRECRLALVVGRNGIPESLIGAVMRGGAKDLTVSDLTPPPLSLFHRICCDACEWTKGLIVSIRVLLVQVLRVAWW